MKYILIQIYNKLWWLCKVQNFRYMYKVTHRKPWTLHLYHSSKKILLDFTPSIICLNYFYTTQKHILQSFKGSELITKELSTYFCFPPRPRVGVPRPLPPRLDPPLPSPGNPPLSSITENGNFKIEQQIRRLNLHITQKSTNSSTHSTFQWNLHCLLALGGVLQSGRTSCQWMTITEN